jgi:ketosteroid isomerase-like protein
MSQENVEIVRRATDAWNRGGWKAVTDAGLLDDEIEYHDDPRWPEARSTVGPAALAERFKEVLEILGTDAKAEVEEVFDAGEQVVLIFRFRGQARASGIPHDYRWGYLYRIRDRRIDFIQAYLDPENALEAAGLRE